MKNVAYARCCVTSDVENNALCCDVRCGGVSDENQNVVV